MKAKDKLHAKRIAVCLWLGIPASTEDQEILNLAYKRMSRPHKVFGKKSLGPTGLHARFSFIIDHMGLYTHSPEKKAKLKKKAKKPGLFTADINKKIAAFYRSYDWRKLRLVVLKKYGARCLCCGQSSKDGIVIHVDHIKPLRKNWELRLVESNLQPLCEVCNHGKGNWDETDWRPA